MRDRNWTEIFSRKGKLRPMTQEERTSLPPMSQDFWWVYESPDGTRLFLSVDEAMFYVAHMSSKAILAHHSSEEDNHE